MHGRFSTRTFQRMDISAHERFSAGHITSQSLKLVLSEFYFRAVCFFYSLVVLNYCYVYGLLCRLMIAKLKMTEYKQIKKDEENIFFKLNVKHRYIICILSA